MKEMIYLLIFNDVHLKKRQSYLCGTISSGCLGSGGIHYLEGMLHLKSHVVDNNSKIEVTAKISERN